MWPKATASGQDQLQIQKNQPALEQAVFTEAAAHTTSASDKCNKTCGRRPQHQGQDKLQQHNKQQQKQQHKQKE